MAREALSSREQLACLQVGEDFLLLHSTRAAEPWLGARKEWDAYQDAVTRHSGAEVDAEGEPFKDVLDARLAWARRMRQVDDWREHLSRKPEMPKRRTDQYRAFEKLVEAGACPYELAGALATGSRAPSREGRRRTTVTPAYMRKLAAAIEDVARRLQRVTNEAGTITQWGFHSNLIEPLLAESKDVRALAPLLDRRRPDLKPLELVQRHVLETTERPHVKWIARLFEVSEDQATPRQRSTPSSALVLAEQIARRRFGGARHPVPTR